MQKIKTILSVCFVCVFFIEVKCQTIFSNNGQYGIIDSDSKEVVVPTEYDIILAGSKYESYGYEEYAHSFILAKNNKYYFALKKYWKTNISKESADGWETFPPLEGNDSIKWEVFNKRFDTLYRLELDVTQYRKNATIQDFESYLGDTCFQIYKGLHHVIYNKAGRYGLLTFDRTSRIFGSYVVGQLRYERIVYSIDNIQIHPAKYDRIMTLPYGNGIDSKNLVTLNNDKYGLLGLGENIEIEPQFDNVPVRTLLTTNYSISNEQTYYYVKKNGLWGVVYLTKENVDNYKVAIPFHYKDIKDIKSNLRNINFYTQHFYDTEESKRMEYDREYAACVYNSSSDTLPVQLNFIIHTGELNERIIRNKNTNKEELNKNYKPPIEKYIKFNPLMNGKPIIQQKKHEYLITSNIEHIKYTKLPTTPLFFVLKMDRLDSVYNNDYNLVNRGKIKKDEIDTNYFKKINEPFASVNQRPKAVAIYRFINDRFVPFSEFVDKNESTTYEVVTDFFEYTTYSPDRKRNVYESNYIQKSTKLENGKYNHTFFTFEGTQVYEITSKFPIDYWRFIKRDPNISSSYIPDEDFALEFYTEIQGRRKTKEKIVCSYNVKTKQFYK